MLTTLKWFTYVVVFFIALVTLLYVTAPDPQFNKASFEAEPLTESLLPAEQGLTLAQKRVGANINTYRVLGFETDTLTAVNLSAFSGNANPNPFTVIAAFTPERMALLVADEAKHETLSFAELLPAAGSGEQHIAIGTNFPEHAEEAASDSVFMFPKFGAATPPRTTVAWIKGGLLDYEVELCTRFDRAIVSIEDFDAAVKGFFLCGDFTERARLLRMLVPQNLDSGKGFSDAKSGADFFPSGGLLVVPNNWRDFVANQRITTSMNGEPRQDARTSEMILDFRELAEKALADMETPRFLYNNDYVKLTPEPKISADTILMSGTSEGVIFTLPTRADLLDGVGAYLRQGAFFGKLGFMPALIESFLASEYQSDHFLQPKDQVEFASSNLGRIVVDVQ